MMTSRPVPSTKQRIATSVRELAELESQGHQARAALIKVRADLAQLNLAVEAAEKRLDSTDAGRLLEANQNLICSTLRAQADADSYAEELKHVSQSAGLDGLTNLSNRGALRDRLTHAIAEARSSGGHVALLFIDLDNFKTINDTLGHAVGDQVLQHAARRITSVTREADTVSRYGGDEFLILLDAIDDPFEASSVASHVASSLRMPWRIGDHVIRLSASIGICFYPDDGDTPEQLIDHADSAMYCAKRQGSGGFVFHADREQQARLNFPGLPSLKQPVKHLDTAVADHERRGSELREANEQLLLAALTAQELQAAAEHSQHRQKEFLALVAHELRNPLTPLGIAASMMCGSDAKGLERMRQIIEQQVDHMNQLVGDLLDLSRSNTGKLRLNIRSIRLRPIINDAIDACRPAMDVRLQHFDIQLPTQPVTLAADPLRLAQILSNLLDNASKYTPHEGEIHLSVCAEEGQVLIRVTDNGIGISTDGLARIFEPFAQDLHAVEFNNQGLGLGLSVVKQLVEGHGGTVVVSSGGIGLGTEFLVTLPLKGPRGKTAGASAKH